MYGSAERQTPGRDEPASVFFAVPPCFMLSVRLSVDTYIPAFCPHSAPHSHFRPVYSDFTLLLLVML